MCSQLFEAARQRLQQRSAVLIDGTLYKQLGGVQTILNTYLDITVEEIASDPQRITTVRSLLQRMINTSGTRRFVSEKVLSSELPDVNVVEIHAFIQKLLDRRVIEEREPTYSLSHDYLVTRVKDWFDPIEMNRKRAQETFERGVAEWKNSQALLNRAQVEAIRKWVTVVSAEEQKLLEDSETNYRQREQDEAERDRQLATSRVARRRAFQIGFAVALVLMVIALVQRQRAITQSRMATAGRLVTEANDLFNEQIDLALLLMSRQSKAPEHGKFEAVY